LAIHSQPQKNKKSRIPRQERSIMIYIYKLTKEPADVIRAPRDACVVILVHLLFFFTMVFDEILLSLIIVATLTDLLSSRNAFFSYIVIILIQVTAKILPLPRNVCPTCQEWIDLQKAGVMSWWRLKEISGSISRRRESMSWWRLKEISGSISRRLEVDELVKTGFILMKAGTRTILENLEKQVPVEFL